MNTLAKKIHIFAKCSLISLGFILLTSSANAEELKKFNFGFDRLESILSKNSFNWNTSYTSRVEAIEERAEAPKQDTATLSVIKRFAALSASLLVEFTSDDSFNEIEIN
jgi:hypothetical protein